MCKNDKTRYYWVRIDNGFFKSNRVSALRGCSRRNKFDVKALDECEIGEIVEQATLSLYLRLMAEACAHGGVLMYDAETPYDDATLSALLNVPESFYQRFKRMAIEMKLLRIGEKGEIILNDLDPYVDSETGAAQRVRDRRAHAKQLDVNPIA